MCFIAIFLLSMCSGQIMSYEVDAVTKPRILGEGPHWDDETQNLYFVDDFGSSIHRYNPSSQRETYCKIQKNLAAALNRFAVHRLHHRLPASSSASTGATSPYEPSYPEPGEGTTLHITATVFRCPRLGGGGGQSLESKSDIADEAASVSIVIPIKGSKNKFAVTVGKNLTVVTWDGETVTPEKIEVIATVDEEEGKEKNLFNDGKVDPTGRLWVGTMGPISSDGSWTPLKGSLYSFPKGQQPKKHVENLSIANGLIWNKAQDKMFYIDSPTRRIDVFDFDPAMGTIANRSLFFDVGPHIMTKNGGPDGMTIDENDNLWFAIFGEGAILNVNGTTGEFIRRVDIPSKNPTSVAFGGANLDELYITSATFGLTDEEKAKYPKAGSVFRVKGLGVKGRKALPADI